MRMIVGTAIALLVAALPAASVQSQQADERFRPPPDATLEAILHSDTGFRGQLLSVRAATPNLNPRWDVRSIRVRSGEWQICTGTNYTGACRTIDRDQPTLANQFRTIRSMRPTGGWETSLGNSLRGSSSEFFPAPMRNGQRIACDGNSCARNEANRFCRSVGWILARSQALEDISGRRYVADVLCARTVL